MLKKLITYLDLRVFFTFHTCSLTTLKAKPTAVGITIFDFFLMACREFPRDGVALVGGIWGTRGVLIWYQHIAAVHCTGNQVGGPRELSTDLIAELQLARWPEGPRFQAVD